MPYKLLVVDDDETVRRLIQRALGCDDFTVVVAENASDALLLARESRPDVLLLDVQMPGLDGRALCKVLKRQTETRAIPVVMMSGALIEEKDILAGFEGGADDYVIKPFSVSVLAARLRAVLRRYQASSQAGGKLKKAGIELDPAGRSIKVRGRPVPLTRKEFDLLSALVSKSGRVLSVPYLLETVWGYDPADYNDPGTVEVHVSHLRKKLGPSIGRRIVNMTGHGYKFES